jgi:hypothetical protein
MPEAKPLFTGEFVAFSEFDRQALKALLREAGPAVKNVAEVGSWLGNGSTRTIIEELRPPSVLYCVDHWRGNPNVRRHQELAELYDVFATFRANVSACGGGEIVRPMLMSSAEAAAVLREGAFDLVFIDADHSHEQTRRDIELWWPKVAPGGILCGHDCEGRPAEFGRELLWENREVDSLEADGRFARVHPGPVLAVAERFGSAARLFADEPIHLEDGTSGYSSIWAVRKPRGGLGAMFAAWLGIGAPGT